MKRKLFAAAFILIIALCCFLFFRYIFYYNKGNNLYERYDYAGAIEAYESALNAHPPHFLSHKECSVRVNLALAMIYNMGPDFADPINIDNSIETLIAARDILPEDGCANNEGDGHSEPAQQLKEEIDKLLEELQQQQEPQPDDSEDNTDGGGGGQEPPIDEETQQQIQDELQNIQTDSFNERQEIIQSNEDFDSDVNYGLDDKIW